MKKTAEAERTMMTSNFIYHELIRVFCIITAALGGDIALGYGLCWLILGYV